MADMTEVGRNPGRVFGLFGAFVGKHPGRRVRIVGECIWPGRSAERYPACVKHEASANKAFGSRELMALCPYDAERLDDDTLADARLTHPLVWQAGSVDHSGEYAPDVALARYNQPLPYNPGAISYTVRKLADLSGARSFASRYAGWHGLSREGIADLQLIATELATNSLRRTGGACRLAFWPHNGHLVCEARDRGRFENGSVTPRVTSPVTPHPPIDSELFVVNAIADLVRTHVTAGATTIQAYLRLGQVPAEAR